MRALFRMMVRAVRGISVIYGAMMIVSSSGFQIVSIRSFGIVVAARV